MIIGSAIGGVSGAIILYEAALGLGIASGPLLGGFLGGISWRGPFFGTAALMAIAFVAIMVLLEELRGARRGRNRDGDPEGPCSSPSTAPAAGSRSPPRRPGSPLRAARVWRSSTCTQAVVVGRRGQLAERASVPAFVVPA